MLESKGRTPNKTFLSNNSLPCWKSIRAEQQEESQVFSVILAAEQNILCSNQRDIIFSWVFFWQSPSLVTRALVFLSNRRCLNLKLFVCCTSQKWILSTWFSVDDNHYRKNQTESYLQPHSGTFLHCCDTTEVEVMPHTAFHISSPLPWRWSVASFTRTAAEKKTEETSLVLKEPHPLWTDTLACCLQLHATLPPDQHHQNCWRVSFFFFSAALIFTLAPLAAHAQKLKPTHIHTT